MKTILISLVSIVALATIPALAADKKAAAPAAAHTLSEFTLGAVITGPAASLDDAKGKAVLIDAWGIHCGPCLASLPDIEKIAKRNKDKMVVFGAHSQQATDAEVKEVVKKNKLSYTIVNGVTKTPISFSGIPHVFVFDTTGKLLFDGSPFDKEFEKSIRKATTGATATAGTSAAASGLDALRKPAAQ